MTCNFLVFLPPLLGLEAHTNMPVFMQSWARHLSFTYVNEDTTSWAHCLLYTNSPGMKFLSCHAYRGVCRCHPAVWRGTDTDPGDAHALSAANAIFFLPDIGIMDHQTISRKGWRVPCELRRRANLTLATAFPRNIKFLRKINLKKRKILSKVRRLLNFFLKKIGIVQPPFIKYKY